MSLSHVCHRNRMIQIRSLKEPIQIDSVHYCDVLQVWASSFVGQLDHFDYCRITFEKEELVLSVNCEEC